MDIPGLELPHGELKADQDLLDRLVASQATIESVKRQREQATAVDPSEYADSRISKARGRKRQAIVNLYGEASKGDLIVVPDTLESSKIYIGEISDTADDRIYIDIPDRYFSIKIPARSVKWLSSVDEQKLSTKLSRSLRVRHTFTILERSIFPEILSLAYSNFIYNGMFSSVIINSLDDFIDKDAALLSVISRLSALCTEKYITESGHPDIVDLFSIILSSGNIEYTSQIATDIHSAGFSRYLGATPTALVIAVAIAIMAALANIPAAQIPQAVDQVEIVNSLAPDDVSCRPPVRGATEMFLQTLGESKIIEMCEAMKEAQRRAGLESTMKATVMPLPPVRPIARR
ncbi:hypothetical protein [Xanthobacter flavus]|uniref:hypothetical protein n=1 Tax=Xanthobacter flavus TaxID=281 RepID=UPI0037284CF4